MKKKNHLLIFPIMALVIAACSDDIPSASQFSTTRSTEDPTSVNATRSLDEALAYADEFFTQFEVDARTRASREVESVEYITTGERTRAAGGVDTLFYLVNYAGEQGFALLGRPSQSYDIYAISTEGRLRMSDTITNKGLAEFFDIATLHAEASSNVFVNPTDSMSIKWYYNITRKVDPLLHKNISVWDQGEPFNKYCPIVSGKRGVTGCGPLAVATLMAHYKWPNKMNNRVINWDAIVEGNDYDKIARLIEDLAAPEYLNATYSKDSESKSRYDSRGILSQSVVNPTMKKWKYDTSDAFNCVNFKEVKDEAFSFIHVGYKLAPPSPILMRGNAASGGHIWVVDGFIERTKINAALLHNPFSKPIEVDPLLHMIWGWGGNGNGYYAYLRDSDMFPKDPQTGNSIPHQFKAPQIFGRYIKQYTE